MKKILLAFVSLLLISTGSYAQTTIASFTFENAANDGQWSLSPTDTGSGSTKWVINSIYAGGGAAGQTPAQNAAITGSTASRYLHITSNSFSGAQQNARYDDNDGDMITHAQMTSDISTTAFSNTTFKVYYCSDGNANEDFGSIQYSINSGTSWVTLVPQLSNVATWTSASFTAAGMDNQATLRFRFRWVNDGDVTNPNDPPAFSVDSVTIVATSSATITTGAPTPAGPYCAGVTISVPYTITGTFGVGNVFTAELSNAAGSFATPVSIGTLSSTTAGSISCVIPAGTASGVGYKIRVMGNNPNVTGSSTAAFTINAQPTTVGTVLVNNTICPGASAQLAVTGTATTFMWMPGSIPATVGTPISVTPSTTTIYTVTGTVTATGCTKTDTAIVIVAPPVVPIGYGDPDTICAGGSSTLTATGASSYVWNPGGLTGSSVTVSPLSTIVYTVTGTTGGCTGTDTAKVVVLTININISANQTICQGTTLTLSATGAANYSWAPGGTTGSTLAITPDTTTTYYVNGNTSGCFDDDTVTITVNATPVATMAPLGIDSICDNGAPITLTGGSPAGGYYACNGVDSITTFTPSNLILGINYISYNFADAVTGCTGKDSVAIFVKNCSTIGINERTVSSSVVASPNPSNGMIQLRFNNKPTSSSYFEVLNVLGQVVLRKDIIESIEKIELETGIYFIKTSYDNSSPLKVVVQ